MAVAAEGASQTRVCARELRRAFSQPRRVDDAACVALVRRADAAAINTGNANGKSPLMFAAQFRPTSAVVEALLAAGADRDATTRRGHTALVFAAGRGRDDTVKALLAGGASARVRTVTGDTAREMGVGRLDPATVALLEHAEQGGGWVDFRDVEDAKDAQREHARHCAFCRAKMGLTADAFDPSAAAEAARRREALEVEAARARNECAAAADAETLARALVAAACRAVVASRPTPVRDAAVAVVGPALRDAAKARPDVALRACGDAMLGRALPGKDRRPVRLVLEALLSVDFELGDVVAFARDDPKSLATAVEVAAACPRDDALVGELLELALAYAKRRFHAGEMLGVHGVLPFRHAKRDGGPAADLLARLHRFAENAAPSRASFLDDLAALAAAQGVARAYHAAVGTEAPATALPPPPPPPPPPSSSLPPLEPRAAPAIWVDDAAGLAAALRALDGAARVGVDTEWGDAGDADPRAPPALVQLATDGDVFLVDVTALRAAAPRALATLAAKLLLGDDGLVVVGFAFGSDAPRLEALLDAAGAKRDVVDLQRLDGRRARLPSLRDCCATWLRRRLDKSEQCSDWDRRPLSASQLAYAALDASVLLPLHDAMVAAK